MSGLFILTLSPLTPLLPFWPGPPVSPCIHISILMNTHVLQIQAFENKLRPSEHVYISPLDHILRGTVQNSTLSPSSPGGPEGPADPGSPTAPGCPSGPAEPASPFSPCRTNGDKYKCLVNSNISCSCGESYLCITIDYFIFLSSLSWALLSVS